MEKNTISINGWQVTNLPRYHPAEAYDRVREEIVSRVSTVPGVVAIMDFGTEPYPGISDIDFYIIFSNVAQTMFVPKIVDFSDEAKYLMMHTLLLVSDEFVPALRYVNPWSRFALERYLWRTSDYREPKILEPEGDVELLSAAFMVDKLDSIFAHIPYFKNKNLPARLIFEICKNAVYCIWRLEDLGIQQTERFAAFVEAFDDTRKRWFGMETNMAVEQLIKHFEEVLCISFEIVWLLNDWLTGRVVSEPTDWFGIRSSNKCIWKQDAHNLYCHTFKYSRLYTSDTLTPQDALELSLKASEKIRVDFFGKVREQTVIPVILPWNISSFLTTTARSHGILSDALKNDIWTNSRELAVIKDHNVDFKIHIQNDLTKLYKEKRIPGGEGKGYVYGNQTFGYMFNNETLLRKMFVKKLRRVFVKNLKQINQLCATG